MLRRGHASCLSSSEHFFCLVGFLSNVFELAPNYAIDTEWDNGGLTIFWEADGNWVPNEKHQPADNATVGGDPKVNTQDTFAS